MLFYLKRETQKVLGKDGLLGSAGHPVKSKVSVSLDK